MKTRKQKGGTLEEIDIRQVFLTKPIKDGILKEKPTMDLSEFPVQKGHQGFTLHKMSGIKKLNLDSLLRREPLIVKKSKYAKKINGERKQLYELIDGRHRFTRAVIMGKKTIKVKIHTDLT